MQWHVIVLDTTSMTYTFYENGKKRKEAKENKSGEQKGKRIVLHTQKDMSQTTQKQAKQAIPPHRNRGRLQ